MRQILQKSQDRYIFSTPSRSLALITNFVLETTHFQKRLYFGTSQRLSHDICSHFFSTAIVLFDTLFMHCVSGTIKTNVNVVFTTVYQFASYKSQSPLIICL